MHDPEHDAPTPMPRPNPGGRRPARLGLVLALGALGVAAVGAEPVARAVDLTGKVAVPAEAPPSEVDAPHYWEEWNGFLDPGRRAFDASRELAVVLLGPTSSEPVGCAHALVGGDLAPHTVVARVGSPFRIENRGAAAHVLFAEGLAEFTPLQTAPGNARSLSIPRAGTWPIRDRIYPHVRGALVTVPDLVACADVAADGTYRFPEVAPGEYRVAVFREGRPVLEHPVQVANRNTVVEDLALP